MKRYKNQEEALKDYRTTNKYWGGFMAQGPFSDDSGSFWKLYELNYDYTSSRYIQSEVVAEVEEWLPEFKEDPYRIAKELRKSIDED